MGYNTRFEGTVTVTPPLNEAECEVIRDIASGSSKVLEVTDPERPDSYLGWGPTSAGTGICWDGSEKFYDSPEWMKYLIKHLLGPGARSWVDANLALDWRLKLFTCDHVLEGELDAYGEEGGDVWRLSVKGNVVGVARAETTFGSPEPI